MQSPSLRDPCAVLGAVKAQPGNAGASRKPSATAGLDRPCARRDRRSAGRDEGTAPGSNKEIARSLGITPETVKTHLKNIFVRFSVTKRSQAVARAQSLGLVKT